MVLPLTAEVAARATLPSSVSAGELRVTLFVLTSAAAAMRGAESQHPAEPTSALATVAATCRLATVGTKVT